MCYSSCGLLDFSTLLFLFFVYVGKVFEGDVVLMSPTILRSMVGPFLLYAFPPYIPSGPGVIGPALLMRGLICLWGLPWQRLLTHRKYPLSLTA